ncbi:MAG: hypothetical protein NZ518_05455, partial [Dehalococcoidia bacterium]|nr:hypothetical protein [Dehalococcoidia bacterium]
ERPWRALSLIVGVIVAVSPLAVPIWSALPGVFAQPYQLLGIAVIAGALVVAAIVERLDLARAFPAAVCLTLALVAGYPNLRFQPVQPHHPIMFNPWVFDDRIVLLDYTLRDSAPRPDGVIVVTLAWQTRAPVERDLTVFTHLVDLTGRVIAQHDGPPVNGKRPTSGWKVGETFQDRHEIRIPSNLPEGRYRVVAGLYSAKTGERVAGWQGASRTDSVVIAEVVIR